MSPDQWMRVAAVADLSDGEVIGVDPDVVKVCLARVDDKYYALSDRRSNVATRLSGGEFHPVDLEVERPLDDSRSSLGDGKLHKVSADEPVEVFAVRVEGNEIVVGPAEGQ